MYLFRKIFLLLILVLISSPLFAGVEIIPQPNFVKVLDGKVFVFNSETVIVGSESISDIAKQFDGYVSSSFGWHLPIKSKSLLNCINLELVDDSDLGEEGYILQVRCDRIDIKAYHRAGLFYGIQTLRQLLPNEVFSNNDANVKWEVPCVEILDVPRFNWRGMHLDVSRHFMPVEFVKKYLDLMAMHKLNRFHWHLTDDQGWRLEIEAYPKLTSVGAWRDRTLISPKNDPNELYDDIRYGGYYTKEQVREIVQYAKDLFIEIVPEIEMPGHCTAAIAAYPELSCSGDACKVAEKWGVFNHAYCPGKEEVFEFNQKVLEEVFDLFPSEYVHIGADEVLKDSWIKCKLCQTRMANEHLVTEDELQSYFVGRIGKFLTKHNKKMIGWDEILQGGLSSKSTLMCWTGESDAVKAIQQGHDVIMALKWYYYFDCYQSSPAISPIAHTRFIPLEKVYSYEPVPLAISDTDKKHVVGVQANLWTEYICSPKQAEYMIYPRACALSETAWTAPSNKNLKDFKRRLSIHTDRLDRMGVNYYKAESSAKPKNIVRLMSYNIMYGGANRKPIEWCIRGRPQGYKTKSGDRITDIINLIKSNDPDIVFLQECNNWDANDNEILNVVANNLGMYGAVSNNHSKFRVALLSKFPISNIYWLDDENPFYHNMICADVILNSGKKIKVASQHFGWWGEPLWRNYNADEKAASYSNQYKALLEKLKQESKEGSFIVAGDFNHFYNKRVYNNLSLYNDIRSIGFVDGYREVYDDYSRVISGTSKLTNQKGPIDYIFVSPDLKDNIVGADIIYSHETFEISDHLPVWLDLKI